MYSKIFRSRMHLLLAVLPWTLFFLGAKFAIHYTQLEFMPKELMTLFPAALTAIVFVLGFLLTGVVADYKESERIPNEITASFFALWQEAYQLAVHKKQRAGLEMAKELQSLLVLFKHTLKDLEYQQFHHSLNSLMLKFMAHENEIAAPSFVRIKNEFTNLKRSLNRIRVIKETDFVPSAFFSVRFVALIFLSGSLFLNFQPWWGGLMMTGFFTFMIFTVLILIQDLEDPFEYTDGFEVVDEISLDIMDRMILEMDALNQVHAAIELKPKAG